MSEYPIPHGLARRIDHTLLRPEAGEADIRRLCDEARRYSFFGVCINPLWVRLAVECLENTDIKVISVAGFPLGASRTDIKVAEACSAVEDGALEIDMVAPIGLMRDDRFAEVEADIRKVRRNLPNMVTLKVILEVGLLTPGQIRNGVSAVVNAGAQFVKTGTGFFGVCTTEQVVLLFGLSSGRIQVKAAGGIKTLDQCHALLEAGASRIGSSGSVAIMQEPAGLV
jgi:deoxyribose-phosphate aldolase